MITFKHQGNFNNTEGFFNRVITAHNISILEKYARKGVEILNSVTPVDSGKTASSWGFNIINDKKGLSISWTNSNIVDGTPIAILIQCGHATGNGGYVQGRDYINPSLRPLFDQLTNELWKEVSI